MRMDIIWLSQSAENQNRFSQYSNHNTDLSDIRQISMASKLSVRKTF